MTQDFVSAVRRYELEIAKATADYERRLSAANQQLSAAMLAFEHDRALEADASRMSQSKSVSNPYRR